MEKLLEQVPLVDFFRQKVQTAFANQQIVVSEVLEFYVVNLLQEFRKTEKLFEQKGSKMFEKPLALIFAEAAKGDPSTKIRCLKQLGDISLYTAGFFRESIRRKIIDLEYYIGMGGSAYQILSQMLHHQKTFGELYGELSKLFPHLIDVLSEIASTVPLKNNCDLLKLYEKWLATGDEHLKNQLNQAGIVTQERNTTNKIQ